MAASANRFANPDLFCPLGHAHQHNVHDANAGGDQRDKADHECANTDDAGNIHKSALERVVGVNLEIVRVGRSQSTRDPHRAHRAIESPVVGVGRKGLARDINGAFGFAVIFEEPRDRHDAHIILTLAKGRALLGQHSDDGVGMPGDANDFADRRLVREQSFLDRLADHDDATREIDILLVEVASISDGECISGKKTAIGPDNRQTWCGLDAIVDRLSLEITSEAFKTNFARIPIHQLRVMLSLLVGDVSPVLIFLFHFAATGIDVYRKLGKLENVRAKKADPVLDRIL